MSIRRRFACVVLPVLMTLALVPTVWAQDQAKTDQDGGPAQRWVDFNHYVLVAQPTLAKANAQALLSVGPQKLLDIVEASEYRSNYSSTLERAERTAGLEKVAKELAQHIEEARLARSREPARIKADIQNLGASARQRYNATERLKAAGQYAAPLLLQDLLDDQESALHPFILSAITNIGRPLVYPLATALPHLHARPMGQIATALAEIGYPQALPYVKLALENPHLDSETRAVLQGAFDKLAKIAGLPTHMSATQLFLTLGQNYYTAETRGKQIPGFDAKTDKGIVWVYSKEVGLVPVPVPASIYGDVLAMRAAHQVLTLTPGSDAALTLWLAANVRRGQRLPAGAVDPSYPSTMRPPVFYLRAAGPARQEAVLTRALDDADANLAVAAIDALADTAGSEALLHATGGTDPLLRALYYPDRRVRFKAAFVLADLHPTKSFPGADRVVPVLAEAVRAGEGKYAAVLAENQATLNTLAAAVKQLGYTPLAARTQEQLNDELRTIPGVDVIVAQLPAPAFETMMQQVASDYRLGSTPVVEVATGADQIALQAAYADKSRRPVIAGSADTPVLQSAIAEAAQRAAGAAISPEEATQYAVAALTRLGRMAVCPGIYKVAQAEPALIRDLDDSRPEVVRLAGKVLSLISGPAAQRALADAALDANRPIEQRIALLGSLAESATAEGNRLTAEQIGKLDSLVKTSQGELAVAAARAHGALAMPAADVVKIIAAGQ